MLSEIRIIKYEISDFEPIEVTGVSIDQTNILDKAFINDDGFN